MKNRPAFTLMEILLSVALMSVLVLGVNIYFVSSLRSAKKATVSAIVKSEGELIQSDLVQEIKFAKRINGCDSTHLFLLNSEGFDVVYEINTNRLIKTVNPPIPTPTKYLNLNSSRTSITNCGSDIFSCQFGGKYVNICFNLNISNSIDTTDSSTMTFRNYVYNEN